MLRRYSYNDETNEETVRPNLWENRAEVKTQAEAMEALADHLSDYGIAEAVSGKLDDVESFCKSWDIPFNRPLYHKIMALMDKRRWATGYDEDEDSDDYGTDHYWTSSSEGC